jgi:hypothetical protein
MVTVCLTSCGRQDLLERTIKSFYEFNTYPIKRFIVSEDSGKIGINHELSILFPEIEFINDGVSQGQIKSIDSMYQMVDTKYVFHLEDDWEFYRKGFIEYSLEKMERDGKLINVWLRERDDTNGHPHLSGLLALNYNGWSGFTFNPTLKRMKDYKRLGSYSRYVSFSRSRPWESEKKIGKIYKNLGYHAEISEVGFVKHIGWDRHVM